MDTLPDFSNSKIIIKARVEAALKERKKSINNFTLFLCTFFMFIGFAVIYLNDIFNINRKFNGALLSSNLDDDFVIELPNSLSISSSGDMKLIKKSDLVQAKNE